MGQTVVVQDEDTSTERAEEAETRLKTGKGEPEIWRIKRRARGWRAKVRATATNERKKETE